MPYYGMRGDYYRGDYYRGDFFGSLVGGITGAVKGFATGGIGGAISGAVQGFGAGGGSGKAPASGGSVFPQIPKTFAQGFQQGSNPFPGLTGPSGGGQVVPKGYHLNKHKYYTSSGTVEAHTKLVKNRHMNVTNARALRRASTRAHGFLKLSRHLVRYYEAHAHKGKAYIGRRKRSR